MSDEFPEGLEGFAKGFAHGWAAPEDDGWLIAQKMDQTGKYPLVFTWMSHRKAMRELGLGLIALCKWRVG